MNDRLSLRLRVFLFFALIAIGGCAAIATAMVYLGRTAAAPKIDDLVLMGGAAGAVVLGLATWVWLKFDEHVVRPIIAVSNHLKAVAHARAERAMPKGTARYLGFLEPVVQEVTGAFAETRREVDRTVASATQGSEQKNQYLATILRDLQQGVVICNLSHQVLLYNQRALEILHVSGEIGLGRSFFSVVTEQPFRHALTRLENRFVQVRYPGHPDGLAVLVIAATITGNYTLKARVSLTLGNDGKGGPDQPIGYVVIFEDVTDELAAGIWRDRMLHEVTSDMRQRVANLAMVGDLLTLDDTVDAEERAAARATFQEDGKALAERLDRLGVVSLVARLHPLIEQAGWLNGLGAVRPLGETVSIDLTLDDAAQLAGYRSNHRRDLKRLARDGYTTERDASPAALAAFIEVYHANMRRVGAVADYYFDAGYFRGLTDALGSDFDLFVCRRDGEVAGGACFMRHGPVVQYHLGAVADAHLAAAPLKQLLDAARRHYTAEGAEILHLGGGRGGSDDSLLRFKSGFSPRRHPFALWCWVIDNAAYAALTEACPETGFFPAYRAPPG